MTYEQEYLIHLLSCAINEKAPKTPEKTVDWQLLKEIAEKQKILPLIYDSVAKLESFGPDAEMMKKWQEETLFCTYFFAMQNEQFYSVFKAAEEKGVDMLLLKGVVLKDLYPVPELRTMGDCDAIIKRKQLEKIKDVFLSEGYSIDKELETTVDFTKEGYLKFELFYEVFSSIKKQKEFKINVWENAVPVIGNHIKRMSDEHAFIHTVAHLAKHIRFSGAGIRNLADIVLLSEKTVLNWEYIINQMRLLNIEKLFYGIMKTAERYFDLKLDFNCPDIEPKMTEGLAEFMLSNGIYGANDNIFIYDVRRAEGKKTKQLLNYLKRFFPPKEKLSTRYAYAKKYPVLLPIAWVHRLFKVIFIDKFSVKHGMKSMKNASDTATKQMELLKYFEMDYFLN